MKIRILFQVLLALACAFPFGGCASTSYQEPAVAVGVGTHGGGVALMSDTLTFGAGRFYGGRHSFTGGGLHVGLPGYRGSRYTRGQAVPAYPQGSNVREIPPPAEAQAAGAAQAQPQDMEAHSGPRVSSAETARPPFDNGSRADWVRYDEQHHSLLPYYRGQSFRR